MTVCEHCRGSGLSDKQGPDDDKLLDRVVLSAIAIDSLNSEIEVLRMALEAVSECDNKHDLTPYDYMHGDDEVRIVMRRVKDALGINVAHADKEASQSTPPASTPPT